MPATAGVSVQADISSDPQQPVTDDEMVDLRAQIAKLNRRVDELAKPAPRSPIGLELSLGIPIEDNQIYWSVELSYKWAYLQYHFAHGGGVGLRPTLKFGDRVEWQVLRVGLHFWHSEPVSFISIDRIWDIVIGSKLTVRVYHRWRLSAAVAWYAPNPYDVQDWSMAERDRKAAEELNEQFGKIKTVAEGWLKGDTQGWQDDWAELPTEGDITKDAYRSVGLRPHVLIGVAYDF